MHMCAGPGIRDCGDCPARIQRCPARRERVLARSQGCVCRGGTEHVLHQPVFVAILIAERLRIGGRQARMSLFVARFAPIGGTGQPMRYR